MLVSFLYLLGIVLGLLEVLLKRHIQRLGLIALAGVQTRGRQLLGHCLIVRLLPIDYGFVWESLVLLALKLIALEDKGRLRAELLLFGRFWGLCLFWGVVFDDLLNRHVMNVKFIVVSDWFARWGVWLFLPVCLREERQARVGLWHFRFGERPAVRFLTLLLCRERILCIFYQLLCWKLGNWTRLS